MLLPFPTAAALAFAALVAFAAPAASSRAQTAATGYSPSVVITKAGTNIPAESHDSQIDIKFIMDAYVVSASRTEQNIKLTPSSVTSLALSEMQRIQIPDLRAALKLTPGVSITETGGGAGSQSSISIRGAGPNQTLFLVDGIRMNAEDWTSDYRNFLGAAGLAGFGRVEILRGPQSTLYGSAAMGGVVSLETTRGHGPASGRVTVDGGSFNTLGATAAVAGSAPLITEFTSRPQTLSYSAALTASRTKNDRDHNTAKQKSASTRIEYQLDSTITAGLTYRGLRASYEEPGSTTSPWFGIIDTNTDIVTLYAAWKPAAAFDTRLTYGWVQSIYNWDDGFSPNNSHNTRNVLDWQNTWRAHEQLQLVAGVNAEWSRYSGASLKSERLASAYINAVAAPLKNLEITAGARADDYSTFNTHATWRAGAAYRIQKTNTTLRATCGTGFNAPAPEYVNGGGWYVANPDLKPEKSKGWDIGVEQDLLRDRVTIGATWFRNDFTNKFAYEYDAFWNTFTRNIPGATTKGVEAFIYTRPVDGLNAQLAYTRLDARDNAGARLARMPRHTLAADMNYQFTKNLLAGAGVHWLGGRLDSVWGAPITMPDCTVVRAYASYALPRGLKLKLRVENVLNKKYETIAGYPALPLGVFGGVEWRF